MTVDYGVTQRYVPNDRRRTEPDARLFFSVTAVLSLPHHHSRGNSTAVLSALCVSLAARTIIETLNLSQKVRSLMRAVGLVQGDIYGKSEIP